ncbi:UNVERIFIED_CONTAM: hypothetical protein Slati_1746300 [Sesamum latifolium]|uniref:Uncharacterized protein n=1 Tax=Sesamum latifolium TaxID=2727402 RepID=A0AAW2WX10_9LAMI
MPPSQISDLEYQRLEAAIAKLTVVVNKFQSSMNASVDSMMVAATKLRQHLLITSFSPPYHPQSLRR